MVWLVVFHEPQFLLTINPNFWPVGILGFMLFENFPLKLLRLALCIFVRHILNTSQPQQIGRMDVKRKHHAPQNDGLVSDPFLDDSWCATRRSCFTRVGGLNRASGRGRLSLVVNSSSNQLAGRKRGEVPSKSMESTRWCQLKQLPTASSYGIPTIYRQDSHQQYLGTFLIEARTCITHCKIWADNWEPRYVNMYVYLYICMCLFVWLFACQYVDVSGDTSHMSRFNLIVSVEYLQFCCWVSQSFPHIIVHVRLQIRSHIRGRHTNRRDVDVD